MTASLLTSLLVSATLFVPDAGLAVSAQPVAAEASTRAEAPRGTSERPALWGRSLVFGGSFGAGSPLGVAGVFAELNPTRLQSVSWGGGYGGFGVTWAAMLTQRFLLLDDAAWLVRAGYSMSITPSSYRASPELSVPAASHWLNIELGREWRFGGRRLLRAGVGHAFALNGSSFRCSKNDLGACSAASASSVPGWAPYGGGSVEPEQAALAHAAGKSLHMWFVHVDFGAIIGL